ncbi:MAG: T9SS type A sorting domain-containing protein [Cytophagaceae bacterium]
MKRFTFLILLLFSFQFIFGQKVPKLEASEDDIISLPCSGGSVNRSALAYNPNEGLYYSVNAGRDTLPIETFNEEGLLLHSDKPGFDYRGAWWNPHTNTLEGNGRLSIGIWRQNLHQQTAYAINGVSRIADGSISVRQMVGDYDYVNDLIIYYNGNLIVRFDKSTNKVVDSLEVLGLPNVDNVHPNAVVYTGQEGYEYGLYDFVDKVLYYINAHNGVVNGSTQLPGSAASVNTYMISYANERFWIYDDDVWKGYSILRDRISPLSVEPVSEAKQSFKMIASGGTQNRMAVAYNPQEKLYYSTNGGAPNLPIETFSEEGDHLLSNPADFDYRGVWWNPYSNALEGNGLRQSGIWRQNLNEAGKAISGGMGIIEGTVDLNNQVGDYDFYNNLIVYYIDGKIIRFSGVANEVVDTLHIIGLSDLEKYNSTSVIYTGKKGYDYGVYNFVERKVEYIDAESAQVTGSTSLPADAPGESSYRFSFANNQIWLFHQNDREWIGYTAFDCGPGEFEEELTICEGDSVFLQGRYRFTPGTYYDNFIAESGCDSVVITNLMVNPAPEVSVGDDREICRGEEIVLEATGGLDYEWEPEIEEGVPFVPDTTVYTVTGTDENGCSATDKVLVTMHELPNVSAGEDLAVCEGEEIKLEGAGAEFYEWDPAIEDGVSFVATETTVYTVTGTNENGCSGSDELTVTVHENPEVSAGDDVTICEGQGVVLSGSGADIFTWNHNVVNNRVFVPVETRTYIVYGVDGNGCSNTDEVEVVVKPKPNVALFIPVEIATLCHNESPFRMSGGSPSGGVYWGSGISGDVFDPSAAGEGSHIVSYTYTDENNCSATADQEIEVEVCTGVEKPEAIDFVVYPNPSSGKVFIQSMEQVSIKVFDYKGGLVGFFENVYDLSLDLPGGLYFVYAYSDGGKIIRKIIID